MTSSRLGSKRTLRRWGVTTDDILTNNSLTRNPCLCAELFKNLLKSGYHSLFVVSVVRLINSIVQPNLDREDSTVSFKTKVLHFFVLFTCRQVTKSN